MANEAELTQVIELSPGVIEGKGMDWSASRVVRAISKARLALAIERVSLFERPGDFAGCRVTVTVEPMTAKPAPV